MCLTMIDPASSWFEMVELPVKDILPTDDKTKEAYFDKSSEMISLLVNKCWFSRYPCLKYPTPAIGGLFYGVACGSGLGRASNTRSENKNLYLETSE